jgi:phosphoglycolate phosphatase
LGGAESEEEIQRALAFFLKYYEEHKMDNTCAYPGVAETLEALKDLPMAVLTNKPVRVSVRILDALNLSRHFRTIYGGNSFETKKPDPFGANTILLELGVPAAETMLVGDSDVDVQTARNAGMQSAMVTYGFGVYDREANPADVYVNRATELVSLINRASPTE